MAQTASVSTLDVQTVNDIILQDAIKSTITEYYAKTLTALKGTLSVPNPGEAVKVTRPLSGIAPRLKNKFGAFSWNTKGGVNRVTNFLTTNASVSTRERVQVFQTWSTPHVLVFGAGVTEFSLSGLLLNTEQYPWLRNITDSYKATISASQFYRQFSSLSFKIDNVRFQDVVVTGMQFGLGADSPNATPFSLSALVLDWSVEEEDSSFLTSGGQVGELPKLANPNYFGPISAPDGLLGGGPGSLYWWVTQNIPAKLRGVLNLKDQVAKFYERITFDRAIGMPTNFEWTDEAPSRLAPIQIGTRKK